MTDVDSSQCLMPDKKINMSNTSELYQKHFGDIHPVCLSHPNMESFFSALNKDCELEDEIKQVERQIIIKECELENLEVRLDDLKEKRIANTR